MKIPSQEKYVLEFEKKSFFLRNSFTYVFQSLLAISISGNFANVFMRIGNIEIVILNITILFPTQIMYIFEGFFELPYIPYFWQP